LFRSTEAAHSTSVERTQKVVRIGTHRSRDVEETVRRVLRLAPVMGITRVANVTGLDAVGIPVVMVCRPNARSLAVSQGKGCDLSSARASGLMEATELYHAETITLPLRLATYEELRYKYRVADPRELAHSSGSRFHHNLRLPWAEGRDLVSDATVLIPYEIVHTNYTVPPPDGHGCFTSSSNGLASGNHPLEAISHGVCEVVERDATTLWKLRGKARLQEGRLDLSTIDDPTCQELLQKFDRARIAVAVWELSSDINLPVFACYILPREDATFWRSANLAAGFGCHPARNIALARALTEAAQSRLTFISGSRDDFWREAYDPWPDHDLIEAVLDQALSVCKRPFSNIPNWDNETLEEDVACELQCLNEAGLKEVIVVDLTKEELGIPVFRVVVPGLESMAVPDYLPGRRGRKILERTT
jgi:YcaO-like protein with predicted kinase domain